MDDVTPGTVAVIVHPDGTEEIVKDSVVTENGVRLIVDGGATWYEKGQQWAVGNGISDGTSPDSSITRAQIAVFLWAMAQK